MMQKMSIRSLFKIAFSIALILPSPAYAQTFEQRVDRYVSSFSSHEAFSGVILAAVGGRIIYHKGFGLASREFGIANGPDTKFQVGSISKAFTAVLALKLAEKGILKLDATISDYLADYPAATGKKITIRQLLSHTSGIPHHIDAVPGYWVSQDKIFHTPRELWRLFANVPLAHEPGERFTYSSPGFYVLGAILQLATKKSYAELLREYIFDPLGMEDSSVENNRTIRSSMASGYMRGLSGLIRSGFEDKSTALAAGDLVTTVHDLFLWDRGMKAGSSAILSGESKALLFRPVFPGEAYTIGGPLLDIPYDGGRKTLTCNRLSGSSAGYAAAMDRMINPDACVIVLSNIQDAETTRILDDVSDFLLRHVLGIAIGNPAPPTVTPPPAASVAPADSEKILGFYRDSSGPILGVVRDGGKIYQLSYSGGHVSPPVLEMVPQGGDSFGLGYLSVLQCRYTVAGKDGRPALMSFFNGRATGTALKIDPLSVNTSEYGGCYTSVELQKTYRFSPGPAGLTAEKFLGQANLPMVFLEKDLFGFERGFVLFTRSVDGAISGFTLMTEDTDSFFGSKFIKL